MNVQFGLETVDHAAPPPNIYPGFFSDFSVSTLQSLNDVCHQSLFPLGAILFVEGQNPRGMFILCTGKVNLSTTSSEGKILILKTTAAGDALGLSAAILGMGAAETAISCELSFVDRKHFLELMQSESDVALHTAQSLGRDFQSACTIWCLLDLRQSSWPGSCCRSRPPGSGSLRESPSFLDDPRGDGAAHWLFA